MVSIPCAPAVAIRLPLLTQTRFPSFHRPPPFRKRILAPRSLPATTTSAAAAASDPPERPQVRTLFPGGFKRPEIKVPTVALRVDAEEVLGGEGSRIDAAVSDGVGMVVLDGGGDESGGRLYAAARAVKAVVGDRAYFLVADRVDIAAAVGASGVLLSDKGIPTIVARNMMMQSRLDDVYLPLVARTVQSLEAAVSAASSEGADFLIMSILGENYARVRESSFTEDVKVPTFFTMAGWLGEESPSKLALKLFQSGACGIVVSLDDLKLFGADFLKEVYSIEHEADSIMQDDYHNLNKVEIDDVRVVNGKKRIPGFTKLRDKEIQLIEEERLLLHDAVAIIYKAAPTMKEVSLLVDAASRLTEPFLLVIVGEFNSGKSTVINALLGRKYLKDGVVPTTNEITLLCYSKTDSNEQERCERHPDGQFICYLSAPILKEMNFVDTPGTNVILQRQQRLTEEFVPRADLILFVVSADRPLTQSEVSFLLYVQQWKKKVVFVLNKLDLYRNTSELEEATAFIKENTWKLLNEDVRLYPVSARAALEAKLSASVSDGRKYDECLFNDPRWISSRYFELEKFLFSFLDGSTDTGMERMRLKLETPIGIADRLLSSSERLVQKEYDDANQDLITIKELVSSVKEYTTRMENESMSWRRQTLSLIESAKSRVTSLIGTILQLSNIELVATYAFKGERSGSSPATSAVQNEIITPAVSDIQRLLGEYVAWLQTNNAREGKLYVERFNSRWPAFANERNDIQTEPYRVLSGREELSLTVIDNFNASAATRLLEQEIHEVVIGTFGGMGAAGLSASLLTSILPSTLEDLLALALCSAGGLVAISKFPTRRKEVIEKLEKVANRLASEIEESMQRDLMQSTEKLKYFVEVISKPYQEAAQERVNRLLEVQGELQNIEEKLHNLKKDVQNLQVPLINSTVKSG